jgi:hypothetical protein
MCDYFWRVFVAVLTMLRQPQKPTLPLDRYSGFDPF